MVPSRPPTPTPTPTRAVPADGVSLRPSGTRRETPLVGLFRLLRASASYLWGGAEAISPHERPTSGAEPHPSCPRRTESSLEELRVHTVARQLAREDARRVDTSTSIDFLLLRRGGKKKGEGGDQDQDQDQGRGTRNANLQLSHVARRGFRIRYRSPFSFLFGVSVRIVVFL